MNPFDQKQLSPPQHNQNDYKQSPYIKENTSREDYPDLNECINHDAIKPMENGLIDSLYARTRDNFVFKVYSILILQLTVTSLMCAASIYSTAFLHFQMEAQWLIWVCLALVLVTQIAIFCCEAGRKHPINLILLLVFTLGESYFVSFYCGQFALTNGSQLVLMAAIMTLAITCTLSLYAFMFPTDFKVLCAILGCAVVAMLMFGIFALIAWTPILTNLYCTLGVIVFGIYLIIDTQLILGSDRRVQLSTDDYVVGAMLLYIDIIQIFLYILRILGKK